MAQVSDAESIILGLLSFISGGCYGYEIEKMLIGSRIRVCGNIAFSSIYHALKKLEKKQMITCEIEYVNGKPPRKRYTILDSGKEALHEKVMTSLQESSQVSSAADLSLFFLPLLHKEQMQEALKAHILMLQEVYAAYSVASTELPHLLSLNFAINFAIKHIELHQQIVAVRIKWAESLLLTLDEKSEEEIKASVKWMTQVALQKHQVHFEERGG
ncbi:MAG: PadR family transcriptional regulator [Methanomicrobiales archaeon]|jgi:DNA-binding PadR family transcriptional regulator|nr:PadR family transcriptional regulator [Methanomicrobiales archaeon]